MDYFVNDTVLNQSAQYLKDNADKIVLCDKAVTTYSDADTNNGSGSGGKIAEKTVTATNFTVGDGPADGRKCESAAHAAVAVVANGDGTHIAWLDTANTTLLAVTKLSSQRDGLTTADTVDIPVHSVRFRDAVVAS